MGTLTSAIAASRSALTAERVRIEAAVSNLANAESTRGPDGTPYRRRDVVLEAQPVGPFDTLVGGGTPAAGVRVAGVVEDRAPFQRRYQPSHPDADAEGFVALPNVDQAEEMVDMLGAARAYQANLSAITLIRDVIQRALELGK
ncbi:MAG: flagellar basal body rod protein FlgC [Acidobacteria bacterium]|nr:MAG: flagellar basal body rod protein FlgC [Acidobacteriota bacterium]